MRELADWIYTTRLSALANDVAWLWPLSESLHFCGLALLVGTVGLFDLRLLGLGKGFEPRALHRLVRFGIAGFAVSVATGVIFIAGAPEQYFFNDAFHVKAVALVAAGANALVFYAAHFGRVARLGPYDDAPLGAKVSAAVSLALLVTIMGSGRMLTFFRPTFMG